MSRALPALTTTGDPAHQGLEANIRRALDQMHSQTQGQIDAAADYSPASSTDWAAPAPTSQASALDRLAAAVAGLLGGPIP